MCVCVQIRRGRGRYRPNFVGMSVYVYMCARARWLSIAVAPPCEAVPAFLGRHDSAVHAPVLADAYDAHHTDTGHPADAHARDLHGEIWVVCPVDGWRWGAARGYRRCA